ncbi:MAG: GNAT family N-acetyltransferase [Blastocatellia bacterium]
MFSLKLDDGLELRLLEERHAEAVFAVVDRNRAYLRQWLPWLDVSVSPDDTRSFIKKSLNEFANGERLDTAIWNHGQVIGGISYNFIDWPNRIAHIGYWLASDHQGKGVMTKACRAMVDYAFGELKLNRIEIRCATGNTKSCAIPQRLGFKQEGIQRQAEWLYDHFVDLVIYGMLASDWPSAKLEKE